MVQVSNIGEFIEPGTTASPCQHVFSMYDPSVRTMVQDITVVVRADQFLDVRYCVETLAYSWIIIFFGVFPLYIA